MTTAQWNSWHGSWFYRHLVNLDRTGHKRVVVSTVRLMLLLHLLGVEVKV